MVNLIKKFLDFSQFFIFSGVLVIVLWMFVITPRKIDGVSMFPYLHNRDLILVFKLAYASSRPKRGDVVVFKHSETQDYIKRVIALPGEEIMIQNGKVYINGNILDESDYLGDSVYTTQGATLKEGVPFIVPDNQYICIGDNRPMSTDSREFGAVPIETIEGRALLVWYPPQDAKVINRVKYNISSALKGIKNVAYNLFSPNFR